MYRKFVAVSKNIGRKRGGGIRIYFAHSATTSKAISASTQFYPENKLRVIFTATRTMRALNDDDHSLLAAALAPMDKIPNTIFHSVTSAALTKTGEIITAFNVYHFTGGPCAEQVVFGAAAARGFLPKDLIGIVAMAKEARKVLNPCGKCRQVMRDLCPGISVIVIGEGGELGVVGMEELLPLAYVGEGEE